MGMLRNLKDGEGSGLGSMRRPCSGCGWQVTDAYVMECQEDSVETLDLVFMCRACADSTFANQADDASIR